MILKPVSFVSRCLFITGADWFTTLIPYRLLPFAPGFALLNYETMWINDLKFPREELMAYYKEHYDPDPRFELIVMYPHDQFNDGVFVKRSIYHDKLINNSLNHLINEMYADVNYRS